MSTDQRSLEQIIEDLAPIHPAAREYHHLLCEARWGKTAKWLTVAGIIYNVGVLVFAVLYVRMHTGS